MTEEEKKVILNLKDFIYRVDNKYKLNITNSKILKDILNLIEKQQRTMKSQEKIIMEQEKEIDNYKKQEFGNLFNGRYISKDKIRDKIKELEKNNKHYVDVISGKEIRSLDDDKIDLLNELLGE